MQSRIAPPSAPAPGMMVGHNSNSYPVNLPNTMASDSATIPNPRFPFNPAANSSAPKSVYSFSASQEGSASSPLTPCGVGFEAGKKKRGRPRKYSPEGSIALGLSPTPVSSSVGPSTDPNNTSYEPLPKRNRGRPAGLGKKQLDALGPGGVGFTPHVIKVKAGEDIASTIMAFSQQGPRTICILSANGAICNVTLRQPAMSSGTVTYEGRFEIISLSGSFMLTESNGSRSRSGGLSVSLAGSDGRVLGGGVAGMLMAATPVQVIVGSFIAAGKKSNPNLPKTELPSPPVPQMLSFVSQTAPASPPSSEGGLSESSNENGSSPIDHDSGPYDSAGVERMHSMPVYSAVNWGNS